MINKYLQLFVMSLIPIAAAIGVYLLDKKTKFGSIKKKQKLVIIGSIFGIVAIICNVWKIEASGHILTVSNAVVLIPGILFGAQAGILAGLIAGLTKLLTLFTNTNASVTLSSAFTLIVAGFYAAYLRKYLFEDKKPTAVMALLAGIVIEALSLLGIFLSNLNNPTYAINVIRVITVPEVIANALVIFISCLILNIFKKEFNHTQSSLPTILGRVQRVLIISVLIAFFLTSALIFNLQNTIAKKHVDNYLVAAIDDVASDIMDTSDDNLLNITYNIKKDVNPQTTNADLLDLAEKHSVSEISIINENGIIIKSTNLDFINYDMSYGTQSNEFLCLLSSAEEFVQAYGPISYDSSIYRKYAGVKYGNGFIQVGYDPEHFKSDIEQEIIGITRNRHIGRNGFVLIVDNAGNVLSAPSSFPTDTIELTNEIIEQYQNTTIDFEDNGQKYYIRMRLAEGYSIVSAYPKDEALESRDISIYMNMFLEILIFAVLYGLIYKLIERVVIKKITAVNKSLSKITKGNLDEVVNVKDNLEFAKLSNDINSTVNTLKKYIDEASKRIDAELEFAKNIQSSSLPNVFPAFPNRRDFDIYATMNTAKEVGGDFYDFYMTKSNTLNFLIADVSGKGIPAAMFMMRAKTELKSLTESDMQISDVFTKGNAALCEGNDAGMFVTAWQGSMDLKYGKLTYVNAGHNPPLIKRNGKFEFIKDRSGFILAGMEESIYKQQEINLVPGDIVFLYTDGVTEATNKKKELFGEERLLEVLNKKEYNSMKELCDEVLDEVNKFVDKEDQFDDITMLAFKYIGESMTPTIKFDEASFDDISRITEFVENELIKNDCPQKTIIQINIAIDEIYSNIVKYAYKNGKGPTEVRVIIQDNPKKVFIRFADSGIPYNPIIAKDPDTTLSADEREVGGLGIYMVKKTMDGLKYKYEDGQNILTIEKWF